MKLYGYYRSSASYRIRIVLNLKGIAWEYVSVSLDSGEQRDTLHSSRNPMQMVPVLDLGDTMLSQSLAIADYLEHQHPEPPLLPDNPIKRAQVQEMQQIISSEVQPLANRRVVNHVRTVFNIDDDGVNKWCQKWITAGFTAFEKRAAERSTDGRFSFGDRATLADAWLMLQLYNAQGLGLDLQPYPTIRSIADHCASIDAFANAHPARQPDAPQ